MARSNYYTYLSFKMTCSNFIMRQVMSSVYLVESALQLCKGLKKAFFIFRGYYPFYLIFNIFLISTLIYQTNIKECRLVNAIFEIMIVLKVIYSLLLVFSEPGKIVKDNKVEKYLKFNRKDLANMKAPMGLGTPPLRSEFCYMSRGLYARFETYSFLFMNTIAAKNAGFYYLFYLNEL